MIHELPGLGADSNTYLVTSDRVCVIDPGVKADKVLNRIGSNRLGINLLINTHCHFDHVGANPKVLESGDVESVMHDIDARAVVEGSDEFQLASLFGREPVRHEVTTKVVDGDFISLGSCALEVIHTPGHTAGGICLYLEDEGVLFSGDTMFAGSIGRTDFPGGSDRDLGASLERLIEFIEDKGVEKILPGHGPSFEAGQVRAIHNAFF